MILALLLLASPAFATIRCVGTVSGTITCGVSVAKSGANVQSQMDAAACGDTIYLEASGPSSRYTNNFYVMRKNCPANNPITITSGQPDFLPCSTCRVTPAHLAVMPVLSGNFSNGPIIGAREGDGSYGNAPPSGWSWVGVGITSEVTNQTSYYIVSTGGAGVTDGTLPAYYIQDAADSPDAITFDRCVIWNRFTDLSSTSTGDYENYRLMFTNGKNITVKNSFLWPQYGGRVDSQALSLNTGPGPITLENNSIGGGSESFITGGSQPDYPGGHTGSWVSRFNYFWVPYKNYPVYWSDDSSSIAWNGYGGSCDTINQFPGCYATANPYPNDYTTNLSRNGGTFKWMCLKNRGEWKLVDGAIHQYNVHEFQPRDGGGNCGSQNNGLTITIRQAGVINPVQGGNSGQSLWMDATYPGPGVGSLTSTGTGFTWQSSCGDGGPPIPYCGTSGGYPLTYWINVGNGVCNQFNAKSLDSAYDVISLAFDCHRVSGITSRDVTGAVPSVGTLGQAFSPDLTHPTTTLTAGIDASTLTIPVVSTVGFDASWFLKIDNEYVAICALDATSFTACTGGRGYRMYNQSTTAAAHAMGATVEVARGWVWNIDNDGELKNVVVRDNVFRDVSTGFTVLHKDRTGWSEDSQPETGRIVGLQVKNNLFYDTIPNLRHRAAIGMTAAEAVTKWAPTESSSDIQIENNTFDWTVGGVEGPLEFGLLYGADGFSAALVPKTTGFLFRSNLIPQTNIFGTGYSIFTSHGATISAFSDYSDTSATSAWNYNLFPFTNLSGCGSVNCAGTLGGSYASNVSWLPGTFKAAPTALIAKSGYDGRDMGANYGRLPLVRNLQTQASSLTALLEFDVAAPISDAGSTQPCMLDVSASEEVRSYVGLSGQPWTVPWTNINALNPAMFKNANQSNQVNTLLLSAVTGNGFVSWPIGRNATVTGDDGISHNLALTPSTQYWGALRCYGDTQHFTFTTAAASSGATGIVKNFNPPATVATVAVDYGPTSALGTTVTGSVSGGAASVTIPATAGTPVYSRYRYLTGGSALVYQSPIQITLP